jgi:hypothetical protein
MWMQVVSDAMEDLKRKWMSFISSQLEAVMTCTRSK